MTFTQPHTRKYSYINLAVATHLKQFAVELSELNGTLHFVLENKLILQVS